jgi:tetratricopeptide (TPR) repeat protein
MEARKLRPVPERRRPARRFLLLLAGAALAAGWSAPASATWREASTAHFVIYSEQSSKALADFATKLEKFDKAMRYLRHLGEENSVKSSRVTVFVLSDEGLVQKLYGTGARRNGYAIMGFYMPRAGASTAFVSRPSADEGTFDLSAQTVLLHEYAHHFMLQNFPSAYPAWFVEGFAEFYSTASFEKDGAVGLGRAALHRASDLLRDKPVPVEKLVAITRARLGSEEGAAVYARGWLLVHYLTMEKSRQGQLGDYLGRIARGESSLDAARAAFGDLHALDRELDRYLNTTLYYLRVPADKVQVPQPTVRELSPGENAMMRLRIRSTRGVDRDEAATLVTAMEQAAAPYPNDPGAQNVLAEGEYDAGRFAEAEAAADRALKAEPKSMHAMIYKARAEMALARAAGDRSDARWSAIRKILIAANRLDTEDPQPLIWYFRSYLAQGVKPPAVAADGLIKALELAPQDTGLRLAVAHRLLVDGKAHEARVVLGPVAFDPHGGPAAELASRTIALIDGEGPKAALEAWNKAGVPEGEADEPKKRDD